MVRRSIHDFINVPYKKQTPTGLCYRDTHSAWEGEYQARNRYEAVANYYLKEISEVDSPNPVYESMLQGFKEMCDSGDIAEVLELARIVPNVMYSIDIPFKHSAPDDLYLGDMQYVGTHEASRRMHYQNIWGSSKSATLFRKTLNDDARTQLRDMRVKVSVDKNNECIPEFYRKTILDTTTGIIEDPLPTGRIVRARMRNFKVDFERVYTSSPFSGGAWSYGVKIKKLTPSSNNPFTTAGLEVGDVILKFNDQLILNENDAARIVDNTELNEELLVEYLSKDMADEVAKHIFGRGFVNVNPWFRLDNNYNISWPSENSSLQHGDKLLSFSIFSPDQDCIKIEHTRSSDRNWQVPLLENEKHCTEYQVYRRRTEQEVQFLKFATPPPTVTTKLDKFLNSILRKLMEAVKKAPEEHSFHQNIGRLLVQSISTVKKMIVIQDELNNLINEPDYKNQWDTRYEEHESEFQAVSRIKEECHELLERMQNMTKEEFAKPPRAAQELPAQYAQVKILLPHTAVFKATDTAAAQAAAAAARAATILKQLEAAAQPAAAQAAAVAAQEAAVAAQAVVAAAAAAQPKELMAAAQAAEKAAQAAQAAQSEARAALSQAVVAVGHPKKVLAAAQLAAAAAAAAQAAAAASAKAAAAVSAKAAAAKQLPLLQKAATEAKKAATAAQKAATAAQAAAEQAWSYDASAATQYAKAEAETKARTAEDAARAAAAQAATDEFAKRIRTGLGTKESPTILCTLSDLMLTIKVNFDGSDGSKVVQTLRKLFKDKKTAETILLTRVSKVIPSQSKAIFSRSENVTVVKPTFKDQKGDLIEPQGPVLLTKLYEKVSRLSRGVNGLSNQLKGVTEKTVAEHIAKLYDKIEMLQNDSLGLFQLLKANELDPKDLIKLKMRTENFRDRDEPIKKEDIDLLYQDFKNLERDIQNVKKKNCIAPVSFSTSSVPNHWLISSSNWNGQLGSHMFSDIDNNPLKNNLIDSLYSYARNFGTTSWQTATQFKLVNKTSDYAAFCDIETKSLLDSDQTLDTLEYPVPVMVMSVRNHDPNRPRALNIRPVLAFEVSTGGGVLSSVKYEQDFQMIEKIKNTVELQNVQAGTPKEFEINNLELIRWSGRYFEYIKIGDKGRSRQHLALCSTTLERSFQIPRGNREYKYQNQHFSNQFLAAPQHAIKAWRARQDNSVPIEPRPGKVEEIWEVDGNGSLEANPEEEENRDIAPPLDEAFKSWLNGLPSDMKKHVMIYRDLLWIGKLYVLMQNLDGWSSNKQIVQYYNGSKEGSRGRYDRDACAFVSLLQGHSDAEPHDIQHMLEEEPIWKSRENDKSRAGKLKEMLFKILRILKINNITRNATEEAMVFAFYKHLLMYFCHAPTRKKSQGLDDVTKFRLKHLETAKEQIVVRKGENFIHLSIELHKIITEYLKEDLEKFPEVTKTSQQQPCYGSNIIYFAVKRDDIFDDTAEACRLIETGIARKQAYQLGNITEYSDDTHVKELISKIRTSYLENLFSHMMYETSSGHLPRNVFLALQLNSGGQTFFDKTLESFKTFSQLLRKLPKDLLTEIVDSLRKTHYCYEMYRHAHQTELDQDLQALCDLRLVNPQLPGRVYLTPKLLTDLYAEQLKIDSSGTVPSDVKSQENYDQSLKQTIYKYKQYELLITDPSDQRKYSLILQLNATGPRDSNPDFKNVIRALLDSEMSYSTLANICFVLCKKDPQERERFVNEYLRLDADEKNLKGRFGRNFSKQWTDAWEDLLVDRQMVSLSEYLREVTETEPIKFDSRETPFDHIKGVDWLEEDKLKMTETRMRQRLTSHYKFNLINQLCNIDLHDARIAAIQKVVCDKSIMGRTLRNFEKEKKYAPIAFFLLQNYEDAREGVDAWKKRFNLELPSKSDLKLGDVKDAWKYIHEREDFFKTTLNITQIKWYWNVNDLLEFGNLEEALEHAEYQNGKLFLQNVKSFLERDERDKLNAYIEQRGEGPVEPIPIDEKKDSRRRRTSPSPQRRLSNARRHHDSLPRHSTGTYHTSQFQLYQLPQPPPQQPYQLPQPPPQQPYQPPQPPPQQHSPQQPYQLQQPPPQQPYQPLTPVHYQQSPPVHYQQSPPVHYQQSPQYQPHPNAYDLYMQDANLRFHKAQMDMALGYNGANNNMTPATSEMSTPDLSNQPHPPPPATPSSP